MKQHAQAKIVEMFCEANNLNNNLVPTQTKKIIADSVAPFYLFFECLEPSAISESTNPNHGLLITLTRRMFEVLSGVMSLLAIGHLQQAEILSRTLMESSLSLMYIARENTGVRLVQYFESYIKQEREQNRKWKKEVCNLEDLLRADHEARINNKEAALDDYETFIKIYASEINVSYPSAKGWPNFIGICEAIDKAVDYRTVYMAMCSQAHHDAEDILNEFMVGSVADPNNLYARLEAEKGNFSLFLVLCGARYYLECLEHIGKIFGFNSVAIQSSKSHQNMSHVAEQAASSNFVSNTIHAYIQK